MEKFVIQEHSKLCGGDWCHAETLLFQFNFKFYLLIYPTCVEHGGHIDFKEEFINIGLRTSGLPDISRGERLTEVVGKNAEAGILKKNIREIVYIYSASIDYCFYRTLKFAEYIQSSLSYEDNYRNAYEQLKSDPIASENGRFHNLVKQLDNIYSSNRFNLHLDEYQILNLNDNIIKQIVYEPKNNNKRSRHISSRRLDNATA